ncbi:MAG: hypothetical protein WCJ49_09775 [Deltaproteobacteria bacterium]
MSIIDIRGHTNTLSDKFESKRVAIDVGATIGVGLSTDMRIAYTGSFGDMTTVHGGSLSFKFNDLNTELTASYANAYDGNKPSADDYNAFFGVTVHY